jgi:hypothetical protein
MALGSEAIEVSIHSFILPKRASPDRIYVMTDTEGLDTVILIPSNFEAVDSTERVQLSMPDESPTRSLHRQFHVRGLVSSFYSSGSRQKKHIQSLGL